MEEGDEKGRGVGEGVEGQEEGGRGIWYRENEIERKHKTKNLRKEE